MTLFHYEAIDAAGQKARGEVHAGDEISALDQLAQRGLIATQISDQDAPKPWWARDLSFRGGKTRIRPDDLAQFFTLFSTMMQARLPLPRALSFCEAQTRNRDLGKALARAQAAVSDGRRLSDALAETEISIPERYFILLRLGEDANQLALTSGHAAQTLKRDIALQQQIRSAMIYPFILMGMSVLVLGLLLFFLTPSLLPVFTSAAVAPPAILQFLDQVRLLLISYWPVITLGSALMLALFMLNRHRLSHILTRVMFYLPVTGQWQRQKETQRLCQVLAMTLKSGAPLTEALKIASGATTHTTYIKLVTDTLDAVTSGGKVSDVLTSDPAIADIAKPLIETGEESDSLPEMLQIAADTLAADLSETLNRAVGMITPVLTILIGGGIGAVILATISGIMDLNDIAF